MSLTLERIEGLAPDQASLGAARKLMKAGNWPTLAAAEGLVWGECQGSGATPYRVALQEEDAGYKCTCPSRKFPCKHSLALMWMRVEGKFAFGVAAVPDWVRDWLSRRRGPSGGNVAAAGASVALVSENEDVAVVDPLVEKRAAEARERKRLEREAAVLAGLEELDVWLLDQVQLGMLHFVNQAAQACRTIAQRLVDAKAAGLAGRLDALVARLYTLPAPVRPQVAIRELGQIYLISQAYRRQGDLPEKLAADARQAVGWQITRAALLGDTDVLRVRGSWRVFAVRSEVQPDRLRRVETWLRLEGQAQDAVLIDFVPISAGAAAGGYLPGDRLRAELGFYPSAVPLRAQIFSSQGGTETAADGLSLPEESLQESYTRYEAALARLPWLGVMPLSFRSARVRRSGESLYLCDEKSGLSLPLSSAQSVMALPLVGVGNFDGIGLWNGYEFHLAWAETRWGRWVQS